MRLPEVIFNFSTYNPRRLPIINGLHKAYQQILDSNEGFLNDHRFYFTLDFPVQIPNSHKLIYYDVEGLYESFVKGFPDLIFTVEKNAIKNLERFYNCPVYHLPLGFDPEVYYPRDVEQEIDVGFCGTLFDPRPEVLSWLAPLSYKFNIQALIPTSWASRFKNRENIKVVSNCEWFSNSVVVDFFLKSKIILCTNRSKINRDHSQNQTIGRVFGEAALNRCIFIDDSRDISPFFNPGDEVIVYKLDDQGENLRTLINLYLSNNQSRYQVSEKGFKRTFKDHTWYQRLKTILEVINNF